MERAGADGIGQEPAMGDDPFAEFTETGFRGLVRVLKAAGYAFAFYEDPPQDRHVLWRHDVDVSLQRALALATIEADEGVQATYFVNPRSVFYGVAEPAAAAIVRRIARMGHAIGLHFDAEEHRAAGDGGDLAAAVRREAELLRLATGLEVRSVSWHNPELFGLLGIDDEMVGGLRNAYSRRLRDAYAYGSDSNGYWRFKPMLEVIAEGHPRLHLLTHPEWWTPVPMSPSDRIDRALDGRATANRQLYDRLLVDGNRVNLGAAAGRP